MAAVEVKVPDIGDFDEVAVIEVLVKVGDTVKAEQSLITVESDKASMEIPSSTAGVVKEIKVEVGGKVKEGSVVLIVGQCVIANNSEPELAQKLTEFLLSPLAQANVLEYIPSSAKLSEMVQTNEAAIFPLTPTAVAALKVKGIPVEYAQPKEGSVVLMVGQCVIANNSEPDLSQKLAEFLLSPLAQANVLQYGAQIPTNPKAPAVGEGAQQVADINKWMKNAVTLDWESVNANRPAWNARWNKTIER